jgi:hypothetical protein
LLLSVVLGHCIVDFVLKEKKSEKKKKKKKKAFSLGKETEICLEISVNS